MINYDVVIAGAGASGLCAAIEAARAGMSVLILERMDKPAKKILATGNGKCNYTNRAMHENCYRGNEKFIKIFLECCPWEATVTFFERLGIWPKEKDGYFYPNSEQAASVAEALLMECERLDIRIALSEPVQSAVHKSDGFIVRTQQRQIKARTFILATGGCAYPKLGSNGSGYEIAKQFGHKIKTVVPALCGLHCEGLFGMKTPKFFKMISGVRVDGKVTLYVDGQEAASDIGQIQLTGYGISGIPVFQISRFAAYALKSNKSVYAELDFFADISEEELFRRLKKRVEVADDKNMVQFLAGMINSKLISVLIKYAGLKDEQYASSLKNSEISKLVRALKKFRLAIVKTNDFEEAQVCAGGLSTAEFDVRTMASKRINGLFVTGELLDIDGICGGYNLHFAFQSGRLAGKSAAKLVKGGNIC